MDENQDRITISQEKLAANRRNGQRSTGPKAESGKSWSRRNALKHGILASALLIIEGQGAEDQAEFQELLVRLHLDLSPVGALEEVLVERITVCLWRHKRALTCERVGWLDAISPWITNLKWLNNLRGCWTLGHSRS